MDRGWGLRRLRIKSLEEGVVGIAVWVAVEKSSSGFKYFQSGIGYRKIYSYIISQI